MEGLRERTDYGSRMVETGKPAPDFSLRSDSGDTVHLADLRGKPVVVYFYPKDDTPGCTTQACAIRDSWGQFEKAGATVLGISPDSAEAQVNVKADKHREWALAELAKLND